MILGNGQLGKAIAAVFSDDIIDRSTCDVTNKEQVTNLILRAKPTHLFNCTAYTKVDIAEEEREKANAVNNEAVGYITEACEKIGAVLIHFSTDYVFDGENTEGYDESSQPNPLSVYGKTKFKGEKKALQYKKTYLIRTSWLYGEGKNFVRTITHLSKEKPEIRIINDQRGSPTYTKDLAESMKEVLKNPPGVFHRTNDGSCSWYEFAVEILRLHNNTTPIHPIPTSEYPQKATRPKYSTLKSKLPPLRHWKEALKEYVGDHH
jgi:dTDP-4-dehydrorhamnose reductase